MFVLGLDCASPELVLERFRDQLPVLRGLCERGSYGPLHSVHPPITIPAWTSMLTGRDPGQLGIYGFRTRRDRSYEPAALNDASSVRAPALWDLLGAQGLESIVVGNPQSYPVVPIRGHLVTGMLTPPDAEHYTWPTSLARDIERWVGEYAFDSAAHRSGDRERIRDEVWQMTERRFRVIRELVRSRPWQLCFAHEIGLDRLQHAFWGALDDPRDPDPGVLLDYHRLLDAEIGETLELLPEETVVWIVSDHGARSLEGSFCINEWLVGEGLLRLRPDACDGGRPVAPTTADVDWSRTRAWADGGYCGRVYLNVRDREPEGILGLEAARALREELREKLEALPGPGGEPLGTAVHLPEEVYARTSGVAPDLLVYPGDLALRCAASVGHGRLFLEGNDAGADAANHAWEGLFVRCDPERPGRGRVDGAHLLDVAPTLLERLGQPVPGWMHGGSIP